MQQQGWIHSKKASRSGDQVVSLKHKVTRWSCGQVATVKDRVARRSLCQAALV
jgi:hypothetical protein